MVCLRNFNWFGPTSRMVSTFKHIQWILHYKQTPFVGPWPKNFSKQTYALKTYTYICFICTQRHAQWILEKGDAH